MTFSAARISDLAGGARALRWGVTLGLDLLLPPHCPGCGETVSGADSFCAACFARAGFITEPCCRSCGVAFAHAGQGGMTRLCQSCRDSPPPWHEARAAFAYDDFSRALVLPLKYADRTENARLLAQHMARAGRALLDEAELLVPVPLHRRRLFMRRYNQSALLAAQLSRRTGVAVLVDALARTRPTAALAGLDAKAREAALEDAIVVRPHHAAALAGRRVLLVDDVLTSGATARACTQALLASGVARVDVLAAARTAPGGRDRV